MPNMLNAATVILTISSPILVVLGLLSLAAWRDRRRDAVIARQIRVTDAIASELGAIVAPVVTKPFGGPWRVAIHVPVGRPTIVSRLVAGAHEAPTRSSAGPYELGFGPQSAPGPPLPVVARSTRRLQAA